MTTKLISTIDSPTDLKRLSPEELPQVAGEIRDIIKETVSKTGGHLASSLGAVELTLALHYIFDTPDDKIIWDVGHQAYAHKILTGRRDNFHTLRQKDGISGFPKPKESPHDAFTAGHSSTSISAALGMTVARDLAGKDFKVVAVIGDGSLTAGLAFEGLNQTGHLKKNMIVILNDNEMSIAKNVGALSNFLSRKITGRFANKLKQEIDTFMGSVPRIGGKLRHLAKRAEDSLVTFFTPGMLFEGLGFNYIGPLDGHDIPTLLKTFKGLEEINGPLLLHVITKKGKGYQPAEENPSLFHGIGKFDLETGVPVKSGKLSYTNIFSSSLLEIAESDPRVVAITAAMPDGTGLSKFAEKFPSRFFDVGIAEQHAITFAGGLSKEGFIPVTAIYSTFLQRAYDEVFHDICIDKLPIVLALDRAGLVGADGPTHHGIFDIAYLRHLPNMVVTAPKDEGELRMLLYSATKYGAPVSIRYPRGNALGVDLSVELEEIPVGKAEILREGRDVTILALGSMVMPSLEAADKLKDAGIDAGVVNTRFVKPLDADTILSAAVRTGRLVTVEEGVLQGGFGSAVGELLDEHGVRCPLKRHGIPDRPIEHGTQDELRKELGLDAEGIARFVRKFIAADDTKRQIANR